MTASLSRPPTPPPAAPAASPRTPLRAAISPHTSYRIWHMKNMSRLSLAARASQSNAAHELWILAPLGYERAYFHISSSVVGGLKTEGRKAAAV